MYSAVKINGQPLYKAARKGRPLSARPAPSRSMTSNTSTAPRPTNTPSASPAPRAPTSACWRGDRRRPRRARHAVRPAPHAGRCVQSGPVPHAAGNFSRRRERRTRNQRLGTADRVSLCAAARPARQQRRQGAPAQRLPDEPLLLPPMAATAPTMRPAPVSGSGQRRGRRAQGRKTILRKGLTAQCKYIKV